MKTIYTCLLTFFFSFAAVAQNVGNWPLNSNLSGTAASSMSVSTVSWGSSIPSTAFNGSTEWYGEGGWPSGALDPNAYIQFTLTAAAGHYLVLNTIKLIQRRSNTGSPQGAGPNSWSVRSSLDNYASNIATGTMTYDYVTYTVNLGAAFQQIPSTVTFRVYGYNTTVNSGGISRFVWDNISVQGQSISGVLATQDVSLTARANAAGNISLQWNSEGFSDGASMSLQRSVNGSDYSNVYRQAENGSGVYSYEDGSAPVSGTVYYRVAIANPDGSRYISQVVIVRQGSSDALRIRAVVSQGNTVRTLVHVEETGAYQLSIWSQDGRALVRQALHVEAGESSSELSFGAYPRGVYVLTIAKDGQRISRQFVY